MAHLPSLIVSYRHPSRKRTAAQPPMSAWAKPHQHATPPVFFSAGRSARFTAINSVIHEAVITVIYALHGVKLRFFMRAFLAGYVAAVCNYFYLLIRFSLNIVMTAKN